MKRVFKFYQQFESDGVKFSDCSTQYEVLPYIVEDDAGDSELLAYVKKLGYETVGEPAKIDVLTYYRTQVITNAVKLNEVREIGTPRDPETAPVYLGFITISEGGVLPVMTTIDNPIDKEIAQEIINNQEYGVYDYGETVYGEIVLVKEGWNFYHDIPLLGYDIDSFYKVLKITEEGFSDDTYRCAICGKFDRADNGYTYNFRDIPDGLAGVNCGCYDDYCRDNLEEFIGDSSNPIPLSVANEMAENGILEHVERFIGGMTDGRGGSWGGVPCNEGDPKEIIDGLNQSDPNNSYVISHDESGQFQTYFSVWKVIA